jgi:hypothetical protein
MDFLANLGALAEENAAIEAAAAGASATPAGVAPVDPLVNPQASPVDVPGPELEIGPSEDAPPVPEPISRTRGKVFLGIAVVVAAFLWFNRKKKSRK